jgi:D-serine deaminase-like pyridoxal phosphate-dependent protein
MNKSYDYYKNIFYGKSFPLAFVDLDLFDENIENIAKRAGDKKVRIASKSIRCLPLIKRILQKRPDVFNGVMAFYPDEAIYLYENGIEDILMGYPYLSDIHLQTIGKAIKKGAKIRLMIDNINQAEKASIVAQELEIKFQICLDMDMSTQFPGLYFGVYRSPLKNADLVYKLAKQIQNLKGLNIDSLMGYEAQVAGVGDNIPGKFAQNQVVKILRKISHKNLAKNRAEAVNLLIEKGFDITLVNGGGTGSMEFTKTEKCVTEITAGSGFFNSGLFDYYTNFKHNPAAAFGVEITRAPKDGMYTAAGGGYIASGAVSIEKQPIPYLPAGIELTKNEGLGEVQTPFVYKGREMLNLGDPIFFRHSKAGELCERFNQLYIVSNGKITETVNTYRGDGHCFM